MKKLFFHLLIASIGLPAIAADKTELPADFDYSTIRAHFTKCLESQQSTNYAPEIFESDYVFSHAQAAEITAKIWEEWKKANADFTEDKLNKGRETILQFPGTAKSYSIPVGLEQNLNYGVPDGTPARMTYVFGTRGSSTTPYPMFILMHGSGDVEEEWNAINTVATISYDEPSIYFVPRIPNGWGEWYRWYHKSKQWVWEKLFRQAFLRSEVDNNKIYFTGISEGAYGSQRLASFYADYLAGAGPMAGGEPLTNAPCENLRHVAFNLRTGSNDGTFFRSRLTSYANEYLNMLQEKYPDGYVHSVTLLDGFGHTIPYYNTTPWLRNYSRNPNPKHVNWENFEMDGRYRDGFYNLRVYKRSHTDPKARGYYEMDIDDDNNIDMRVRTVYNQILNSGTQYGATLALEIKKNYDFATTGRFRIYLNDKLVDLSREVTLKVNGKLMFKGILQPTLADIVNSCADYYDPERLFTASIEVDLDNMTATGNITSAISEIETDTSDAVTYYTIQGIEVKSPTAPGLYIRRQGSKTEKIIIR